MKIPTSKASDYFTVSCCKDNCRCSRMGVWWKSTTLFGARTCLEPSTSPAGW